MKSLFEKFNSRYLSFGIVAVISVLLFSCWFVCGIQKSTSVNQSKESLNKSLISLRTEDKKIILNMRELNCEVGDSVQISVIDSKGTVIEKKDIFVNQNKFSFCDGQHGEKYKFDVLVSRKSKKTEKYTSSALFLDYAKMPNFRLLQIDTLDGQNVSYEKVSPPKGCWGATLKNNVYSDASIRIYDNGRLFDKKKIQIKARGNTSAYGQKLPYMLKFFDKYSLNPERRDCLSKKYILLNFSNLGFVLGNYLVDRVQGYGGSAYCFVNVIFNGDYKGSYIAVEPIERYLRRNGLINKSGVILENDPYWWNEDIFFKTPRQIYPMAYTFKYPQISRETDWRYKQVKQIFENYEKTLFENNERYSEFIEERSFVDWLLVHDILAIWDGGGSNMFMFLKDVKAKSKITMGPSWDFDSMFSLDVMGKWESIHISSILNYPTLFKKDGFTKAYVSRWSSIHENIMSDVGAYFLDFSGKYATDVDESWNLNAVRWSSRATNVDSCISWILENLEKRTEWMDKEIEKL